MGGGQWVVIGFTWQPVQANKTVVIETSTDNILKDIDQLFQYS
jgi:hypothetical protein